jgi:replicative DNA helicase
MAIKEQKLPPEGTGLPANISAEKAILGAIMLDNRLFDAAKTLTSEDFSLSSHLLIFLHMKEMIERGAAVDIVTLPEEMKTYGNLSEIGAEPTAYLASLTEETIRFRHAVVDWVKIVQEKAKLRRIIGTCERAAQQAQEQRESAAAIVKLMGESLKAIGKREGK